MPHASSQTFLRELDKKLWTAADKLRSNLDAAVYKHAALGLIFLKYVSDSFAQRQAEIGAQIRDPESDFHLSPADYGTTAKYEEAIAAELEERDYYTEKNVFWVPALARWKTLQNSAKLPAGTEITVKNGKVSKYKITSTGKLIDDALEAVEKENPKLKNVLNKNYTQLQIDPTNLAGLIDLIGSIDFEARRAGNCPSPQPSPTFTRDQHPDLRADFVMANPPFNIKEWWDGKLEGDARWKYGTPPQGNANFACPFAQKT